MQKFFYLSKNRQTLGPYSLARIQQMLDRGQVQGTDYIFLEDTQDWLSLLEFLPTKVQTRQSKVKAAEVEIHENDWFVLQDDKRYGPYAFLEMVKMLQDGSVLEYDYVWNPSMTDWMKLAEVQDFSDNSLKVVSLKGGSPKARRRYPRISLGASLVIHNNQKVWKGDGIEIGEGGCKVSVSNADIEVGSQVTVLFKPSHLLPPFHATCEVVSVDRGIGKSSYSLKFIQVEKKIRKTIKSIAKKAA